MSIVFKDFGTAYLAAPLAVGGLTITVDNPASLPILTNGDYFYLVLQKYGDRSYVEIVKVTATAGNTFTILRGQAGTSIRAFAIGDYAELRLTTDALTEYIAQGISTKMDKSGGGDFSGLYRFLDPSVSRVDIVRTSDSVASSLVVDYSASEGHRTIVGGAIGSNAATPSILLRPNGYGSGVGQVKIDFSGLVDVVGLNVRGAQGTDPGSVVRYDYLSNLVPAVRKVNGRELSSDITLSFSDVKAAPEGFGLGTIGIQKTAQDQTQAGFWRDSAITMAGITLPYDGALSQAFIGVNALNKRLKFGYRSGATTDPIEWFEAYSDNNKPTAAALGVVPTTQLLPLAGGTINWADLVGKVPVINDAGVTELGRYLDMREQGANVDFQWRWDAGLAGADKLCLYNSGGSPVIEFNASGRFNVPANGGDINGRVKVHHGVNPMYEWHIPGKCAAAAYLTVANDWRFVGSDGVGGETAYRFVSYADGNFIARGAVLSDHNTGSAWKSFNTASFRVGNVRTMSAGVYNKLISHQLYSAGNFHLENSLGAYADGAGWDMLCHTLVSTDGGGTSRIWRFRNDGAMYGPIGNAFDKDGNIWGGAFGGASVTYWAINRFAPISDIRYKKNITECKGHALDVIDQFRFYAYDWDESKKIVAGKHHVRFGVSAQDMELIDEAYVKESEVHEVMGEDPVTIKTLDGSNLLTLALKAIQELKARVEFLESRAV